MQALRFDSETATLQQVLVIGAHSDDIEIGAGGTIRWLLTNRPELRVFWIVLSAIGARKQEAESSARKLLGEAPRHQIETFAFRDGFFPYEGSKVKETFERLKTICDPDLILTHHREDLHQDHRIVSELSWNTFRDHLILEYEVPKYDGGLGTPNFSIPLSRELVKAKVDDLMTHFGSQRSKDWFTEETFLGLMRLRGIECRSPTGYAEAFYCRKAVIGTNAASTPLKD